MGIPDDPRGRTAMRPNTFLSAFALMRTVFSGTALDAGESAALRLPGLV
ncbi:hypothetical protein [Streptomyces sp. DSM 41534]